LYHILKALEKDGDKSGVYVKIFCRSGRDSSSDSIRLHRALWETLELNTVECKIKK
jgi:hypothetical protein